MSTEGIPRWATHLDKLNSPRKVVSEVSYLIKKWTLQSFCNKDSMKDFSGWICGVKSVLSTWCKTNFGQADLFNMWYVMLFHSTFGDSYN